MKKLMDSRARITRRRQRGAALILTVVVIMILTTVGMAMVTFTTTEERTATAYRDTLQVRSVAEAGVRMVQMMFNDPDERQLVPRFELTATAPTAGGPYDYNGTDEPTTEASLNSIGIFRANRVGATPAKYTGANDRFFRGPFGESWANVFGGAYTPSNIYDLKFNCTNPTTNAVVANCWLNNNINSLLQTSPDWNLDSGRITDISFYAAPAVNGIQYGITTIRVTAEKRINGELLASETIEAVIGDNNTKPAVLGNGSVNIASSAGTACGDGCEQIHANGNVTVAGNAAGGEDPIVTATGTVNGPAPPISQAGAPAVLTPEINPWDLAYKPKDAVQLSKYYLLASRPLDAVWTDGIPGTNPPPRPCGVNGLSQCQDYNLEYDTAGNAKPARTATMTPHMYRWNAGASEWSLCSSGTTLTCAGGGPTFNVIRAADVTVSGAGDNADLPFNVTRVPMTSFDVSTKEDGATLLVDGKFDKHGSMDAQMSVIAAGSIKLHSSTTWSPSLSNRVMWLSGRDVSLFSNCCAPSNTCATNLTNTAYASVMAAHEQFDAGSQTALFGVVIAENKTYHDNTVPGPLAIDAPNGDHGYSCGQPEWPWTLPTRAVIVSMKSSTN